MQHENFILVCSPYQTGITCPPPNLVILPFSGWINIRWHISFLLLLSTNYHIHSRLKQPKFLIPQSYKSKVPQVCWFLCSGFHKPKSRCWLTSALTWSFWGIGFQAHSGCGKNPVPTEGLKSLFPAGCWLGDFHVLEATRPPPSSKPARYPFHALTLSQFFCSISLTPAGEISLLFEGSSD